MLLGHLDPRHVIADISALTKYKRLSVGVVSELFQKYFFLHTAALHLQLGLDFFSYLFLFLREIDLWR